MAETSPMRPKNVVILDADNPLVEVRGEFFWREDHDQLVAAARQQGFRQGYVAGLAAALRDTPQRIILRRRSPLRRSAIRLIVAALVLSFLLSLLLAGIAASQ